MEEQGRATATADRKVQRPVAGAVGPTAWQSVLEHVFRRGWDAVAICDDRGTVVDANDGFLRLAGCDRRDVVGRSVYELDLFADVERGDDRRGPVGALERRYRTRSGDERFAHVTVQRIDAGGKRWMVVIGRDVTDQKEAEAALHVSIESLMRINEQRKKLLERLVSAQEEERRQISAEIHDDTIQAISSASMSLSMLRRSLTDPEQARQLARTEARVKTALARLRNLAFDLRPPSLHTTGLAAATRDYLAARATDGGLDWDVDNRMDNQPAPETRLVLYRVAQEAVSNVLRHARAKRVDVLLEERDGGFALKVTDDGIGVVAGDQGAMPGHLGLACMTERAELAGGWCRVQNAPEGGTVVECWIPGMGWSLFAEEDLASEATADRPMEALRSIWDQAEEAVEDAVLR